MKHAYKAAKQDGKIVTGLIEAKDPKEAASYLRKEGLMPIQLITPKDTGMSSLLAFRNRVGFKDLVFFTRQLSSMLTSGLTLMQALSILKNQVQNSAMSEMLEDIITNVQEGQSFSLAIAKYPKVFSPIYISLIRAGETSGLLDKVLLRLADNLEKEQKLRGTIKGALTYPIIVVVLMIVVISVLMVFVIPQLTVLYTSLNFPLPLSTRIIIGMSYVVSHYWYLLLLGVGGGYFYFNKWHHTETGKLIIDVWTLKIPLFGKLITQATMADFTRTFGLLVGTGTLVVESLNRSAEILSNVVYKKAVQSVTKKVEKGISIGDSLSSSLVFPPLVVETVRIGEQTGKLDESLTKISEYYEREVEQSVKVLTTALEPAVIIVLAICVGFLVISIITPIYGLITSIQ